jgi:hypothetical protein
MLAARLLRAIEDHAEDLTRAVLDDVSTNPRTPSYHALSRAELHGRVHDVYRNLGRWIDEAAGDAADASYHELGRERRAEGIPLEEVVYALILTKQYLREYVLRNGLVASVVDLYQEEDLNLRLEQFFDRALYQLVKGYQANPPRQTPARKSEVEKTLRSLGSRS